MKLFIVGLLAVLAIASTNAQDEAESPKTVARELYTSVKDYLEGNDDVSFPVQKVVKMFSGVSKIIVDKLPYVNATDIALKVYMSRCGYSNCEMDAPKCISTLIPEEMCDLHKSCIPNALSGFFNGQNPRETMRECVMTSMDLTYDPEDMNANVKSFVEMRLDASEDLTPETIDSIKSAVVGEGCKLPDENACLFDHMKFFECVMNTCVSSMFSSSKDM
ncbi:uncharacterized protein [Palaemon carinicauda]|uniref:uncharacterized protein n=1 Tax=Palaemon carinicauda TaxID=392227 RepID=UPI0035B5EF79